MRKLKLEMDALVVDSFTTQPIDSMRGTVEGQRGATVFDPSCGTCFSCHGDTCDASCGGTCDTGCESWITDCPLC